MKPVIVDIIGDVVTAVQTAYGSPVYYYHGHPLEVVNILLEKDASDTWKLKKYPAIFLYEDIKEQHKPYEIKATLHILILTETKPEYKSDERVTNVFKPILHPLFELFIASLKSNTSILNSGLEYDKTDRKFWGSQQTGANVANDFVDAIEIENLELEFAESCYVVAPVMTFDYTFDFTLQ